MNVYCNDGESRLDLQDEETASLFANDGVLAIRVCQFDEDIADEDCTALINLLRQAPKKIEKVELEWILEASPASLALLLSLCQRAKSLVFTSPQGVPQIASLTSCLLQNDGPEEFLFRCCRPIIDEEDDDDDDEEAHPLTVYETKLLFEGIALSPSLRRLKIFDEFRYQEEVGIALVNALARNRSLESLTLQLVSSDIIAQKLFQTAVLKTKVESLRFSYYFLNPEIPFDVMASTLCREDCSLKTLRMDGVMVVKRDETDELRTSDIGRHNESVTEFRFNHSYRSLDCAHIMEIVGLFRSLVVLELCWNSISDLSALDPLLIGENLILQSLDLFSNRIGQNDLRNFLQKLPKMKRLGYLALGSNPFEYDDFGYAELKEEVIQAVSQNKSLEAIQIFGFEKRCEREKFDLIFDKIKVPLSLNRGGRRALELESSEPLPANLWPLVLKRATDITYCGYEDEWDRFEDSIKSTRVDVVYWLLKEKIVGSIDTLL